MRHAVEVDEPTGERWDLALDLLTTGEAAVIIGPLNLYREANGPAAVGRLHVEIRATLEPSSLTIPKAESDVATGLAQLDELLMSERFAALVAERGITTEFVADYETGESPSQPCLPTAPLYGKEPSSRAHSCLIARSR